MRSLTDAWPEVNDLLRASDAVSALLERIPDDADDIDPAWIVAAAAHIHAIYAGMETIFERVARDKDGGLPTGEAWRRDLLSSMAEANAARPALISHEMRDRLKEYLQFRHWFRHNFAHKVVWPRLSPLANELASTVARFISEIRDLEAALQAPGVANWQE